MNNQVLVKLKSIDVSDTEGYLKDYITKLEDILNKVPEEFRDLVEISYDTYQEAYDDVYRTDIDLQYYRPEIPEETSARELADGIKIAKDKTEKYAQYVKLKKELGL